MYFSSELGKAKDLSSRALNRPKKDENKVGVSVNLYFQ